MMRHGWGWTILAAALLVAGGCSTLLSSSSADLRELLPTFTPTSSIVVLDQGDVTPTPIPTAAEVAQAPPALQDQAAQSQGVNEAAFVDEAGLDLAERRIIDVYERVAPAVVSITTRAIVRDFFYNEIPQEGSGSGFIIDNEGHLLTNYHVVEGAQEIDVIFGEGDTFAADVVGADPRNDIALLRVDAPPELLVPVELGSSETLLVGQRAIAIGNPFGQFGRTMTTGVISALDRTLEGDDGRPITGVIQTDAAINRGNSGGPLLDSSGRVIGINSAIFSPTGANAGVGFAVPVDTVRRLLPDLLELGYYRHPWLGIRYAYALTPRRAQLLELPVDQGLLLVQLFDGSPLAEGGVRGAQREAIVLDQRVYVGGDILLRIDDVPVSRLEQVETLLEDNYRVGDTAMVTLLRDGEEYTIALLLAEEPR
jgi:S1-C subfamily serine protease